MVSEPEEGSGGGRSKSALAYVGLGVELIIPVLVGVFGGAWLDRRFGTTPWLVVAGSLLGIAAGFLNFFRSVLPGSRNGNGEDSPDDGHRSP